MNDTLRIAMWSGPRNISTAMMRSFENRRDCAVTDEPLYGPYLAVTGKPHPGAEEVIREQGADWRPIVARLGGAAPGDRPVWYQKHMTHHVLPGMALDWIDQLVNCFLIREPAHVFASYRVRRSGFDARDLGFPQQLDLFRRVCDRTGTTPPVLDSADVLRNPEGMLRALCNRLDIDFDSAMLKWPAGPRQSDGVWAKHWYDAVWASTGFAPWREREVRLDDADAILVEECRPSYDALYDCRLQPSGG